MVGGAGSRPMRGHVCNEDEGAGLGTGCVRAFSLVFCVRAGAGARVRGGVVAVSGLCGYVGYQGGGVNFSSRTSEYVCWR